MPRPSFFFRELYHRADQPLNLAAAKSVATQLARTASTADLAHALAELATEPYPTPADDQLPRLRAAVERELHRRLDVIAETLTSPEVLTFRLDVGDDPGVQMYVTGGYSEGDDDAPTDAYDHWYIAFDDGLLPEGWINDIANALGLIHPYGTGPTAATVTFRTWS